MNAAWLIILLAAASAAEPTPAGVYFWDYGDAVCEGCPEPAVAVAAGVFATPAAAERAVRRWERRRLAPGYPLVAHTEELGVSKPSGIAVILGLFAAEKDAREWMSRRWKGLRLLTLGDPHELGHQDSWEPLRVVRMDRRKAQAYKQSEVDQIYQTLGAARKGVEALRKLKPICEIPAGKIFVTRNPYAADLWAPVTCGKTPAYVPITATLFRAVIRKQKNEIRLHQIVDVECDMPYIDSWLYDPAKGRSPLPKATYMPGPFDDPGEGRGCEGGPPY